LPQIPPRGHGTRKGEQPGEETRLHGQATLARLVESLPDALVVSDRLGQIIWVNAQVEKLFGYPRAALLGQPVEILVPDRLRRPHEAHRRAYEAAPRVRAIGAGLALRGKRRDGTEFPVDIMLSPIDSDGEHPIVLAVIRDITARQMAEEALHESEERLRAILENSPNLIFLKDTDGRYLLANKEFQAAFHLSQEQLSGKTDAELFPSDQGATFRTNDLQVLRTGVSMEFEEVALHDDGPHTSIVHKFPLRAPDGKIYAIGGIVTDITGRKRAEEALRESEERFRLLVEGVQDYAIFMLNPEGLVVTWNAGAARIKGYRAEDVLAQPFSRFYDPDDIGRGKPHQDLQVAAATGRFEEEAWRLRKDGSRFWAHVVITAIRDSQGKILGYSKVTRDLTERRRFEQELAHERDRLRLLLDLTSSVVSSLDLRGVFGTVSASLRRFTPCDSVMLLFPDPERTKLRVFALDLPGSREFAPEEMFLALEGSEAGLAFQTGRPRTYNGADPALPDLELHRAAAAEGFQSGCALPLISRNRVLGVLTLGRREEKPFTQPDVEFLGQAATQIAIAVENALDYRQVTQARERLAEERLYLQEEIRTEHSAEEIIVGSATMQALMSQIATVAPTDSTVLILGETGTGKELLARAIHTRSFRREKSFIKVSCAAIPLGLLESELFGHEKGAFTGAIARKVGRLELAHQGTLFLDEVGDIPLELQPKLLRVLQEREFERLGSTRTIRVDLRVVAATSRDLTQMVASKQFRSDLYYRLNVFPISVPPLRERLADIPPLVRHFVNSYARRMHKRIPVIPPEAMEALGRYPWPGNVRELQNYIERAVILSPGAVLQAPLGELEKLAQDTPPRANPLANSLAEAEREHILLALQEAHWIIGGPQGAAARLGVRRTTLYSKMERLGISRVSK
jgi:formate hydrogenlyase transcriptional activator